MYTSHSTRSASTTSCEVKGFSITEIMKAAGRGPTLVPLRNFITSPLTMRLILGLWFYSSDLQLQLIAFAVCFVLFDCSIK